MLFMKNLILFVSIFLVVTSVFAISLYFGTLEGKITDENGVALKGVAVTISVIPANTDSKQQTQTGVQTKPTKGQTATSGKNGVYRFTALHPGNYSLTFAQDGYGTVVKNLEVKQSITNTLNIVLHKSE